MLGAALAMVPSIADSTEVAPTVNARSPYSWSPAETTVKPGGSVTFQNSDEGLHGVIWKSGNPETPACSGVPIEKGEAEWHGSCSFTKPGVYRFECAIHHSLMTGTITVSAGATTTSTSTSPSSTSSSTTTTLSSSSFTSSTTTTTTTATPPPSSSTTQTITTSTQPAEPTATTANLAPPAPGHSSPAVSPPPSFTLAKGQHGNAVHGNIEVPSAERGARLEVDLLAARASLGRAKHSTPVRIGLFQRASVAAGRTSFAISIDAQARRALRRSGHLAIVVLVILTPLHGTPVMTTHSLVLHR
jgi:plastocyanin